MSFEFRLPDIGEGIHEGEIVEWLVKVGDAVKEDQPILEVMTDKVTAEIPSPVSGVVTELRGKAGETIKVGSVVVVFDQSGALPAEATSQAPKSAEDPRAIEFNVSDTPAAAAPARTSSDAALTVEQFPKPISKTGVLAAPATRKMARQLGVDLSQVKGSGPRGRVTPGDLQQQQASKSTYGSSPQDAAFAAAPKITPPKPQPITSGQGDQRVPFAGMRKKIAEHLVKSKLTAPHFAYVEEVDMTNLLAVRKDLKDAAEEQGVKLTFLPFIIKAVIAGLRQFPVLNSQLDETTQELVYKGDVHMGVAVATDDGLIVPVIKHADQKSILVLAEEIRALSEKARANKLSLDEIRGGTFTLTSIGSIGGLFGVPIINHPEVTIMGINKISKRPVVRNGEIVIRDMMHLSLSCDHRVVDGAEAAKFTNVVIEHLENPSKLLLL